MQRKEHHRGTEWPHSLEYLVQKRDAPELNPLGTILKISLENI